MSKSTLPDLAAAIAEAFPELGGRAIAVSEAEITPENIPTLPLCMVALRNERADHFAYGNRDPKITEGILVQFMMPSVKYKRDDGSESPFWAHYDYWPLRERMIRLVREWKSPAGFRLEYKSLDIDSTQLSVDITFIFEHEFIWCDEEQGDGISEGDPIKFYFKMTAPKDVCCDECIEPAADCNECAPETRGC